MKTKEFIRKFVSGYVWGNLFAMVVVVVALCFGVKYGLDLYTHHGEGIKVPDLSKMRFAAAKQLLESDGLYIEVSDSGYNKRLPADCILMQTPSAGSMVKSGRVIYVTVNSPSSPTFAIPDLVDNSSYREAEAKLTAMGFRLLPPRYVVGEKDWVYGIMSRGRRVGTGDFVSVEAPLTLLIGNGQYDGSSTEIDYTDPDYGEDEEEDTFEEMPETTTAEPFKAESEYEIEEP
jgi:hypothetical protein